MYKPQRYTRYTITEQDVVDFADKVELDDTRRVMLIASIHHSYKQIAEELEMPIGTVKSRINRARERIGRAKMEHDCAKAQYPN